MTNYLWLVWYRAMTIRTPKHWAFVVIYDQEEDALVTAYQVRLFSYNSLAPKTLN